MTPDEARVDLFRFLLDEYGNDHTISLQGKRIVVTGPYTDPLRLGPDGNKVIILVTGAKR